MNQSRTIKKAKKFVKKECKKPTSKYGFEPFEYRFVPMVGYAKELAKKLDADMEVIEIAGWLHDIGSIISGRKDHHLTGAKIARKFLNDLKYPKGKIDRVCKCIKNHRGSVNNKRGNIEEKIIAEADAMSNFGNIAGLFKAAYIFEDLTQGEAKISVREKLERKWSQLHFKESKDMVRNKYKAIQELLG